MASADEIPSSTITATPKQASNEHTTPFAQKIRTDTTFDFDDTPVVKMDMSPPHLVVPGKGNGQIQKYEAFAVATLFDDTGKGELELASPIFSHRTQHPDLDGNISEDMMEGVQQTATSGSEKPDNGNNTSGDEEIIRVLVPRVNNASQHLVGLDQSIQIGWLGTSTFFLEQNIELQRVVSYEEYFYLRFLTMRYRGISMVL